MIFCEECKYLPNCELAKHEEVDTCKKGEKTLSEQENEDKRKTVKLKSKYTWNGKIDKVC